MGIIGFFSGIAANFRDHYLRLADQVGAGANRPRYDLPDQQVTRAPRDLADRYEPTATAPAEQSAPPSDQLDLSGDQPATTTPSDDTTPAGDTPAGESVEQKPDGTYYLRREARLDYRLDLRFDLAAVQRTVRSLAEGDTESIEQLVGAGFGLSAGFDLRGIQTVETNMTAESGDRQAVAANGLNLLRSRQASQFAAASRNFAVESFQRESSKLMRSSQQLSQNGYQRTVNRFALRYQMDSKLSFAFLDRFNVQTERVAAEMPDSLNRYVDSAGSLAESGSSQMLATFFDSVDQYLDGAEQNLLDKALASFDQAAAELGFSESAAASARTHLSSSIEGFFDRVDTAMDAIRTQFGIAAPVEPPVELPSASTAETLIETA